MNLVFRCFDDFGSVLLTLLLLLARRFRNALVEACKVGTVLLIEDGLMEVKVTETLGMEEVFFD